MAERLDYVKLDPRRILDAGSGRGRDAAMLAQRYPRAGRVALDYSLPLLPRRSFMDRLRGRGAMAVCGDMARLPFAEQAFDLVWSNMALHWLEDPLAVLRECERVLAGEGLLMFSTLGPDTLKELRAAAGAGRVHEFRDMHDVGDMLVAAGFSAPVMDMEVLTVSYPDAHTVLQDLRVSGQTNARADRPRALAGRGFHARLLQALGDAPRITHEVVYGHAWKRARAKPEVKTVRVFKRIS